MLMGSWTSCLSINDRSSQLGKGLNYKSCNRRTFDKGSSQEIARADSPLFVYLDGLGIGLHCAGPFGSSDLDESLVRSPRMRAEIGGRMGKVKRK